MSFLSSDGEQLLRDLSTLVGVANPLGIER